MNKSIRNLIFAGMMVTFVAVPMFASAGGGAPRPDRTTLSNILASAGGGAPRPDRSTLPNTLASAGGGAPRPDFQTTLGI